LARPTRCRKHRDAARRAELAHQLDVADVDAELERGGGHHHLEFAGLETLLGIEARFLRETAVVGCDILLTETLRRGGGTRAPPCGGVLANTSVVWCSFDEPGELVVHRRPDLARHHRLQRRGRHHQVDVAFADVATIDDAACSAAGKRAEGFARKQFVLWTSSNSGSFLPGNACANQQPRDIFYGLLRRGQPDALDTGCAAFASMRASVSARMRTALGLRDGVDFVDDHRAHCREHLATRGAGQQ
jgi:hypothetical protein